MMRVIHNWLYQRQYFQH